MLIEDRFKPFIITDDDRKKAQAEIDRQEKTTISRRDFLKKSTKITASLGATALAVEIDRQTKMSKKSGDAIKEVLHNFFNRNEEKIENQNEPQEDATENQVEIEQEDAQSLHSILDFDQVDKIKLTPEKMEQVKNYWKKRYAKDPKLKKSFQDAYYEMGAWKNELSSIFKKEGVPEKFFYLAIPESHWQLTARSGKGAAGPYQFMPRTAHSYQLKTGRYKGEDKNIDERLDP